MVDSFQFQSLPRLGLRRGGAPGGGYNQPAHQDASKKMLTCDVMVHGESSQPCPLCQQAVEIIAPSEKEYSPARS